MIPLLMTAAYITFTLCAGILSKNKQKNARALFVAHGGMAWYTVVPLLFGELIAGAGTVGNAAEGFKNGINSVWGNWGQAIGCVVFALFAARFFYIAGRNGSMSVAEAFEIRFDQRVRRAVTLVVLLAFFVIYSMQAVAVVSLLGPMLGISGWIILVGCACFFAATALWGIKGIAGMNLLHMLVMVGSLGITAIYSVRDADGAATLYQNLVDTHFNLFYPNAATVIAQIIGAAFSMISAATVVNACYCCRSLKEAKLGILLVALLVSVFALFPTMIGMAGRLLMPESRGNSILYEMAERISPILGGLASMAILAAVLSTGPAILLMLATTVVRDIYLPLRPNATEQQQMRCSHVAVVLIAAVSIFVSAGMKSILNDLLASFQIRGIVGIVLIISLRWPRVNSTAAFWSIAIGGTLAAVWHFLGSPLGIAPLWVSLAVGLTILCIVSLRSNEGKEEYQRYLAICRAIDLQ